MPSDESEVVATYMRVMHVLDCVPGFAGDPKVPTPGGHEPIAILTLSYRNEVEQPIMLSMRDTKKLVAALTEVIAHHEGGQRDDGSDADPNAWPSDWNENDEEDWMAKAMADCAKNDPPRTSGLTTTGIKMRVQYSTSRPPREYEVIGGFTDGKRSVVLYRGYDNDHQPPRAFDSTLPMGESGKHPGGMHEPDECLPIEEWKTFGRLRVGGTFRIKGHQWTKMSHEQIRGLVEGKVL